MRIILILSLSIIGLLGCGSSSNSNGNNNPSPPIVDNQFKAFASLLADDEAKTIDDDGILEADIKSLFNGEDTEPVEVEPDDNIQDVISRAEGS